MIEKVNPSHPDKVADRIAGAIVDLAYSKEENPKIAVEVLIGHGEATVIVESSVEILREEVSVILARILGNYAFLHYVWVKQDVHLADNQKRAMRCGDNGIFKGMPLTDEQKSLSKIARSIYELWPTDGKYIMDEGKLIICQSNARQEDLEARFPYSIINPLGYWTGGTNVDAGATNRKLGSDMADSVTGGGLHGKDLSKADVSVNIWCFLEAQRTGKPVQASCAIGDVSVNGVPYEEIVEVARQFIADCGGFERFSQWGLF